MILDHDWIKAFTFEANSMDHHVRIDQDHHMAFIQIRWEQAEESEEWFKVRVMRIAAHHDKKPIHLLMIQSFLSPSDICYVSDSPQAVFSLMYNGW